MTVERQPSTWYVVASIVCLFVAAPLTRYRRGNCWTTLGERDNR